MARARSARSGVGGCPVRSGPFSEQFADALRDERETRLRGKRLVGAAELAVEPRDGGP